LDTRSKIIPLEEAQARQRTQSTSWLAGHFDPLLAEHVRRLREQAAPDRLLIVEVTNPARPLLPQRARAELVAALSMVDFVVLGHGTGESPAIDTAVSQQFVENVLRRHRGQGAG
jgi:bifunctional ADP-heptose synthase (sugar kinase/adenylyltransferase)